MYVQSISDSNNIAMCGRWDKFKQKLFDKIPDATFKNPSKSLERVTDYISRPGPNRAIMGATAIAIQPAIDASNKKVDEKTRKLSICRTVAKIAVGTLVGIAVRGSVYKAVNKMTQINGKSKLSKSLLAPDFIKEFIKNPEELKIYKNALSTFSALIVMIATNFLIDAPLTAILTNKLQSKVLEKEETLKDKESKEVAYA